MDISFFEKVYEICRKIPYGRVTSYGAVAAFLSTPKASRMVGWALNKSALQSEFVPAHRIVNRNGIMTGKNHFEHFNTMKELLQSEGAIIDDDKILNFKEIFWYPE